MEINTIGVAFLLINIIVANIARYYRPNRKRGFKRSVLLFLLLLINYADRSICNLKAYKREREREESGS